MARFSKRGRNPGAADFWLESLGYYRKNVAYDETCLFRAVSEQLFCTQIKHEEIRKKCITYGKQRSKEFAHIVPKKKDWYDRMKKLSVHMVVCNDLEVQLVAKAYEVDITVFIAATHDKNEFRGHHLYQGRQRLLLCKMGEDHYDAVYPKEHIAAAGFCQSIAYNLLYEGVFGIEDAETIAHSMLHDKQTQYVAYSPESKDECKNMPMDCDDSNSDDHRAIQTTQLAPFPFKIAKALDPNMYRNIEYDTWIEQRREMRLGEWYNGDDKLILGTRCILNYQDEEVECYIQTMFEDDPSKCEVYITKMAERLRVNYTDLRPEANAKPWPLPYRFSRSQATNTVEVPNDIDRKVNLRKRKEKKRLQCTTGQSAKMESKDVTTEVNISNFEGFPLLMQEATKASSSTDQQFSFILNKDTSDHVEEQCDTPLSGTISWPRSPCSETDYAYPNSNAVGGMHSAEHTHYQETTNEVVFAYAPTDSTYVPVWTPQEQYVLTPDSAICEETSANYRTEITSKYVYYAADSAYASSSYSSSLPSTPYAISPFPVPYNNNSRMMCSTPVALNAAQPQEMYPVMYPLSAPGTPVYYPQIPAPPAPNQRPQEYAAIATPQPPPIPIYTPPAVPDMSYVGSGGYMYPATTPPVQWYNPPHINSQGFIFPVPVTTTTHNGTHTVPNSYM